MDMLPADLYQTISRFLLGVECETIALFTANYYIKNIVVIGQIQMITKNYTKFSFDDLPAAKIESLHCLYYYQYDLQHRYDAPAAIFNDGTYVYYCNGLIHRDDGPAYFDGFYHAYYHNDVLQRMVKIE